MNILQLPFIVVFIASTTYQSRISRTGSYLPSSGDQFPYSTENVEVLNRDVRSTRNAFIRLLGILHIDIGMNESPERLQLSKDLKWALAILFQFNPFNRLNYYDIDTALSKLKDSVVDTRIKEILSYLIQSFLYVHYDSYIQINGAAIDHSSFSEKIPIRVRILGCISKNLNIQLIGTPEEISKQLSKKLDIINEECEKLEGQYCKYTPLPSDDSLTSKDPEQKKKTLKLLIYATRAIFYHIYLLNIPRDNAELLTPYTSIISALNECTQDLDNADSIIHKSISDLRQEYLKPSSPWVSSPRMPEFLNFTTKDNEDIPADQLDFCKEFPYLNRAYPIARKALKAVRRHFRDVEILQDLKDIWQYWKDEVPRYREMLIQIAEAEAVKSKPGQEMAVVEPQVVATAQLGESSHIGTDSDSNSAKKLKKATNPNRKGKSAKKPAAAEVNISQVGARPVVIQGPQTVDTLFTTDTSKARVDAELLRDAEVIQAESISANAAEPKATELSNTGKAVEKHGKDQKSLKDPDAKSKTQIDIPGPSSPARQVQPKTYDFEQYTASKSKKRGKKEEPKGTDPQGTATKISRPIIFVAALVIIILICVALYFIFSPSNREEETNDVAIIIDSAEESESFD